MKQKQRKKQKNIYFYHPLKLNMLESGKNWWKQVMEFEIFFSTGRADQWPVSTAIPRLSLSLSTVSTSSSRHSQSLPLLLLLLLLLLLKVAHLTNRSTQHSLGLKIKAVRWKSSHNGNTQDQKGPTISNLAIYNRGEGMGGILYCSNYTVLDKRKYARQCNVFSSKKYVLVILLRFYQHISLQSGSQLGTC